MKPLFFLWLGCLYSLTAVQAGDTYFIGHSLINHYMPAMLEQLADDGGQSYTYRSSIMNGSSLRWQWSNAGRADGGVNSQADLTTGNYETLVLADQVPLQASFRWNDPLGNAKNFINLVPNASQDLGVYLFQTWPHLSSANWVQSSWDQEIAVDRGLLENLAEDLTAELSLTQSARIVPVAHAMQALRDAINGGQVPGLTDLSQIFSDQIHMTNEGNYFVALVFYATFFGDPQGLTSTILTPWGSVFLDVPAARAQKYQEIIWDVVTNDAYSGQTDTGGGGPAPNQPPSAGNDGFSFTPWLSGTILANDTDPDGDNLSVELVQAPSFGQLVLNSDGSFRYLPDNGFSGSDSFQYRVFDGTEYSSPAIVNLQINGF